MQYLFLYEICYFSFFDVAIEMDKKIHMLIVIGLYKFNKRAGPNNFP